MRKILSVILVVTVVFCLLCFTACAPENFNFTITCENVAVGNNISDASVSIFMNGEQYDISNIYWSVMGEDSMEPSMQTRNLKRENTIRCMSIILPWRV